MLAMLARGMIALLLIGALPIADASARKARTHRGNDATERADKTPAKDPKSSSADSAVDQLDRTLDQRIKGICRGC